MVQFEASPSKPPPMSFCNTHVMLLFNSEIVQRIINDFGNLDFALHQYIEHVLVNSFKPLHAKRQSGSQRRRTGGQIGILPKYVLFFLMAFSLFNCLTPMQEFRDIEEANLFYIGPPPSGGLASPTRAKTPGALDFGRWLGESFQHEQKTLGWVDAFSMSK